MRPPLVDLDPGAWDELRSYALRSLLPDTTSSWSGTCLTEVIADPLVWLALILYCAIRAYAWLVDATDSPTFVNVFQPSNISIIGGFLSFFLTIFANQTNGRFLEIYGFSKACSGHTQDAAGMARAVLPPKDGDRLVRHFNAAQLAGYVGLNTIRPRSDRAAPTAGRTSLTCTTGSTPC